MRWTYDGGASEIRDGLDVGWWNFFDTTLPQAIFIPLPNAVYMTRKFLRDLPFSGFILTGGDDWGVFPERDETENLIFEYASSNYAPILGVCRGAQLISRFRGGTERKITGHAGSRHKIFLSGGNTRVVNSFHKFGIAAPGTGLHITAADSEGHVEAFASDDGLIQGIMWHPEREARPDQLDRELFIRMFGEK